MKKYFMLASLITAFVAGAQTITIPVVFHVVYKTTNQNIDDSCLIQQLNVLNEDYNKLNADTAYIPTAWQPIAANLGIHFALATVDPSGNPTTGIERYQTVTTSFSTNDNVKHASTGGMNAWPDSVYLNIWVCNLSAGLLGYAQYPGGPSSTDGVVLHYGVTGLTCALNYAPYSKGRTGTFEVARWLGMRSMIGGGVACTDNDTVQDTPSMENDPIGYIAPFTVITDACQTSAPGVMWMNFMTYGNDSCKYFFTNGQKDVAWYVINNFRMGSINGIQQLTTTDNSANIFPSPTNGKFTLGFLHPLYGETTVVIHNAMGAEILSKKLDGNGKTEFVFDLSGNATGIYFISVNAANQQSTHRIILTQ